MEAHEIDGGSEIEEDMMLIAIDGGGGGGTERQWTTKTNRRIWKRAVSRKRLSLRDLIYDIHWNGWEKREFLRRYCDTTAASNSGRT